jgi:uncharacterized protein (TIGR02246 family)
LEQSSGSFCETVISLRSMALTSKVGRRLFHFISHCLINGSKGRLVGEVKRVRFLTPEVAVAHAGGTIMRGESKPAPARDSIQTLVARRKDGEWKLAAFQNTRLRPMSSGFASILLWNFTDWLWKFLLRKSQMTATARHHEFPRDEPE